MKVILHDLVVLRDRRRQELEINGGKRLVEIAKELNINPEGYLFVRDNTLLTGDELIKDDDVIEIFPIVSGG